MSVQNGDQTAHASLGLSNEQMIEGLRGMIRARAVDDRLWLLSRQGKAHFVITSAGHEATQFGCAWAVNIGRGAGNATVFTETALEARVVDWTPPVPTTTRTFPSTDHTDPTLGPRAGTTDWRVVCCTGNAVQGGAFDQQKMEQRPDILVYSTEPLREGLR